MILSKIKSKTLQDLLKVLSGNIVAQGIGFLAIIIISRDLGPEQYGIFSLLVAIFTVSIQVSDFGVSTSYVKYVSENLSKAKEIFVTVILSKVVLSLLVISALYCSSGFISDFFFDTRQYQGLIEIISIAILFHSFFGVIVSHFQAVQNFKVFAYLNIAHNFFKLLSVIIVAFAFSQEKHLEYFILTYAFVVVTLILAISLKNYRLLKYIKQFDFNFFIQIYKLGFWVFLSSLAVMFIMRLDIMMLQKMSSSLEVGYYSVAMNLAMIFPLITASLVTTLLPKMEEFLQKNTIEEYIRKVLSKIKYVIMLLLILEVFSPFIVSLLFGKEYEESISVFQILLVAFTFGIIINPISVVMYSINKAYLLSIMNWIQLPLNYFGNLLLISVWQADGAAISTTILRILGGLYILIYLLKVKK
ncbi:MAG: flippase [Campylobacterota bacterium]|nr:flippase [Campylobacterota bacterium]